MTFDAYEESRNRGVPTELFLFSYGAGPTDYYAYVDSERAFTHPTNFIEYTPFPMKHDRITVDGGKTRKELNIYSAAGHPLYEQFQIYPPDKSIRVVIQEVHLDDADQEVVTVWVGRVLNIKKLEDDTLQFTCRPMTAAYKQAGLRRHWQLGCPHVLYGAQCAANEVAAQTETTATAVASNRVTLDMGWNSVAVEKYIGGKLTWEVGSNTYNRTILRVGEDSRTLSLSGVPIGLAPGSSVIVTLGCNHQMDDCLDLHDNIHNFGGDPWIPPDNPVNVNPYV